MDYLFGFHRGPAAVDRLYAVGTVPHHHRHENEMTISRCFRFCEEWFGKLIVHTFVAVIAFPFFLVYWFLRLCVLVTGRRVK